MRTKCALFGLVVIIVILLMVGSACADQDIGVYYGVNWKITDSFELVIGDGTRQQFIVARPGGWPWTSYADRITSVRFDGTVYGTGSLRSMFANFTKLSRFDATGFDVSRVTNMENMFSGSKITGTLDLTGWDVRRVEGASSMFHGFVGNVIMPDMQWKRIGSMDSGSLSEMFYAHSGALEVPNWSFGREVWIDSLFRAGKGSINAANWNLDGVESATDLFRLSGGDSQPMTINISGWHSKTLTRATTFFAYSSSIREIDVSNWDMPALENVAEFIGASSDLERVIGLDTWDVSNITNLSMFFYACRSLYDIGDISQWDTSNVTNMQNMFYSTAIRDFDLSGWDVSNVTNFGGMFQQNPPTAAVRTANLAGWCDITPYYMSSLFPSSVDVNRCPLVKLTVGSQWQMQSEDGSRTISLESIDGATIDGVVYSDYWYHESRKYGPFRSTYNSSTNELARNYTSEMAGTWLREPKYYTIHFVPLFEDATGEMDDMQAEAHGLFTLPANEYHLYEHEFVYWQDENDNQYSDGSVIPAGTYFGGDTITLTAVLKSEISYTVQFAADDAAGSMPQLDVGVNYNYKIHKNLFSKFDHVFDHWDDGKGHTYADGERISAGTYEKDEVVVLTAVFVKNQHDVDMTDGVLTFSIKQDETAVFSPIPSNVSYQVYEQIPSGWVLVQRSNDFGTIEALTELDARFLNQYDPEKLMVQFNGLKLMDGEIPEEGSFTFELWDENGYIQSKSVGPGGIVQFDPIEFTVADIGEYHYVIKERVGADDAVIYDGHEEQITVRVYHDGSTVYLHTDNVDDDGNQIGDYESNKYYPTVVTIPGAEKLHVKVKYTNPRGQFYVWKGSHPTEIETRVYTAECNTSPLSTSNPGGTYRAYSYVSGKDYTFRYDEFDVDGDSISILYMSYAYLPSYGYYPNGPYSDMVNYGYYMEIVSGDVVATVETDDDGIKFENISTPGKLVLQKTGFNANNFSCEEPFYYEVQFMTGNGMAYELSDSVITYERRDGSEQDFPDLNVPENPAYGLIVNMIKYSGTVSDVITERYQYHAGDVYSIYNLSDYVLLDITGAEVVQTQSGWQGVMPSEDTEICVRYSQPIDIDGLVLWDDNGDEAQNRPSEVTVHLIRDDASVASMVITDDDDWEFSFKNVPRYDHNGNEIIYSVILDNSWQEEKPIYAISYNGYYIKAVYARATISTSLWKQYVNDANYGSSLPLRSATAFLRNTTYSDVASLPSDAKKIDNGGTQFSVYFWKSGNIGYWWSDANTIYLAAATEMFTSCGSLTEIDLTGIDTSKVTRMDRMFNQCSSLTSLDLSGFETGKVTRMDSMFYGCNNLTSLDVSSFDMHKVTDAHRMFYWCDGLESLDISTWDVSSMTDMSEMFYRCHALTSLTFGNLNTNNVTNMSYMIYECYNLSSVDLSGLNTSSLRSLDSMMRYCSGLTFVNVSGWDVSHVTSMFGMFQQCTALSSLDLSDWNIVSTTNMNYMFGACPNLVTIYVGDGWNVNSVTTGGYIFDGCTSLVGGSGTSYAGTHRDKTYARVDNPPDEPGYLTYKSGQ